MFTDVAKIHSVPAAGAPLNQINLCTVFMNIKECSPVQLLWQNSKMSWDRQTNHRWF